MHYQQINGRILNENANKHIITVNPVSNTSITANNTKVNLKSFSVVGNKLSVSNSGIKIGSGVTKVKISASVTWSSRTASSKGTLTYKNSVAEENLLTRTIYNLDTPVQPTINTTPKLVDVKAGDVIYLYCLDTEGATINGTLSYVTVEVVE